MRGFLLIIFLSLLFSSCNSAPIKDPELHKLVVLLVGSFSNKEQAENDSSFASLHMTNTRIWEERIGYWVYSEVSDANKDHYIYSQRIINYERLDSSTLKGTSYEIPNIEEYNTDQKKSTFLSNLTPDSLEIRAGCQVYFKKKTSTIYSGKTNKGSCTNALDYIDYTTSTYVISKDNISIWTKGYNNNRKQVWGKINGPYKYKRLSIKKQLF
ncbi:chromophore lyase CpcT/CpeT [Aquimarina sediminis]|uniref:chromophore lyase CpcT/CpeT n=1 Tax=Aquimarina sediminis TaxID=2070536 RepID=UPI000CA05B88|nr:chromophore lyase CpcT/CpeT [Aquimarina sediminis]